jgi:hypothetical protein
MRRSIRDYAVNFKFEIGFSAARCQFLGHEKN